MRKNYKKALLQLTQNSKTNHFNNYFHENKENLFKTQQRIREIINTSKKRTAGIKSIEVPNKTVKNSSWIASEFNKHFASFDKQIEGKLIKSIHKYSE